MLPGLELATAMVLDLCDIMNAELRELAAAGCPLIQVEEPRHHGLTTRPDCSEADLYWGLHFALAMAHQTIRDSERLSKLSEGLCDLNDVGGIIERIVAVSAMALTGREVEKKAPARLVARDAR